MPHPPFNIFTQKLDPEGALARLRELLPDPTVEHHPDGQWSTVTAEWKRGWLKKPLSIKVTHDPEYYTSEGWARQLAGMDGYFRRFPSAESRNDLFGYLPGLKFAINFILEPDPVEDDPRQEVVFEMAEFLDGVIFLPGCLLDSQGRTLIAVDGEEDPEARLPAHAPVAPPQPATAGAVEAEHPVHPPSLERIIHRFIILTALVNRGFLEDHEGEDNEGRRRTEVAALKASPAWDEAEPWEKEALETAVGGLPEKIHWKLPWLSEGAAALAWALELLELPPYDQQVSTQPLFDLARELQEGSREVTLRARPELEVLAFQMLAIHWRIRQYSIEREPMDFVGYATRAWCGPMDLGLARIAGRDLEIEGAPISESSEKAWQCAGSIMDERRNAIDWLLGYAEVYSEIDTST